MAKSRRKSMAGRTKKVANERESSGGGFKFNLPDGVEFYTPKKGRKNLIILPYEVGVKNHPEQDKGELWWERTIWVHYGIGLDDKNVLCPKTIGKSCPICEEAARMKKDPDSDDDDVKALAAKQRQIFNVADPKDLDKIMLFEMSYHLFGKQLEEEVREGDDDVGGFADLEDGKTLQIRWAEKKLGKNSFLEANRIDFKDRDDIDEDILDEVLDLDDILNVLSYENLEKMFLGLTDNDTDEEETEPESEQEEQDQIEKEKARGKKTQGGEEDEPRLDANTLKDMSEKKMRKFIKKYDLDGEGNIDIDDNEDEIREDLAQHFNLDLDLDEDEEEKESAADKKKRERKEKKAAEKKEKEEKAAKKDKKKDKSKKGKCPHGHTFSKDCDEEDECDDCDDWNDCKDAQEG